MTGCLWTLETLKECLDRGFPNYVCNNNNDLTDIDVKVGLDTDCEDLHLNFYESLLEQLELNLAGGGQHGLLSNEAENLRYLIINYREKLIRGTWPKWTYVG